VNPNPLSDSSLIMLTSNLLDKEGKCPGFPTRWLAQTNWKIRILGSAALEAIQVAAGVAQAAITMNGKLWVGRRRPRRDPVRSRRRAERPARSGNLSV
jgi:hypothetical protein